MAATRVAVVVDHRAVRTWLLDVVEHHPTLALCGSAATVDEAVRLVAQRQPEVVVLDDRLGDVPAPIACRRLRSGSRPPAVLFLSSLDDDDAVVTRLLAGAAGVVLRGDDGEAVAARVTAAAHPAAPAADGAAGARALLRERLARGSFADAPPFTARLLALLLAGQSDSEIARALGTTPHGIESGVRDVLSRLGLDERRSGRRPPRDARRDEETVRGVHGVPPEGTEVPREHRRRRTTLG